MEESNMDKKESLKTFGFDPNSVGIRNRGYNIVKELDELDESVGANIGDLCVHTRDSGIDCFDNEAMKRDNYLGLINDTGDSTYTYYYFKPLKSVMS